MSNYSESCIMTWPLGVVKRWDIYCENWSLKGELRSNGASTTQNCLENTTAHILEYRTNVNGFSVTILRLSRLSEGFLYVTFNDT